MAENELLESALSYATRGWYVLPCEVGGKEPLGLLVPHGLLDASREPATIQRWWKRAPRANIGISCGPSHLVVADIDVKKKAPGLKSWQQLLDKYGVELADTLSQHTPTGGIHYLYNTNEHELRNTTGKLAKGIDTRAAGGYIVVAPSTTTEGRYSWDTDPISTTIADLPAALATMLAETTTERTTAPIQPTKPGDYARAEAALTKLAPWRCEDYEPWVNVGMALSELGAAGLELWDTWSSKSGKYKPFLCAEKWDTFTPGEGITLASLFHWASEDNPAPTGAIPVQVNEPPADWEIEYQLMHQVSESGNAERLIRLHGADLRYCDGLGGWLVWSGQRWQPDETGEVQRRASRLSDAIYEERSHIADKEQRDRLASCAAKAETLRFITATMVLATSNLAVVSRLNDWDNNPWLFNVENGTLDLRTGVLLPHHPADLLTKMAPVHYAPDAIDARFDYYLDSVTSHDPDLKAYLQRVAGYSLTGDTREDVFLLVLGPTQSGKSTFVDAMIEMMGDYGMAASFETFLQRQANAGGARPDVVRLRGARFVGASEAEKNQRLAEEFLKRLSGGDKLAERGLYSNGIEFRPTFKIWLAANESPRIRDDNTALWARLKPVPFEMQLPPDKIDRTLKSYLLNDPGARSAILAWAVDGCLMWQAGGLGECPAIEKRKQTLQASFDPLGEFINTECIIATNVEVEAKRLRVAYDAWANTNLGAHEKALSNKELGKRLMTHGCESRRESRGGIRCSYWHGIGLQSDQVETLL